MDKLSMSWYIRAVSVGVGLGIILLVIILSIVHSVQDDNCKVSEDFTVCFHPDKLTIQPSNVNLTKSELELIEIFVNGCIYCIPTCSCRPNYLIGSKLVIRKFTKCNIPDICYLVTVPFDCKALLEILVAR